MALADAPAGVRELPRPRGKRPVEDPIEHLRLPALEFEPLGAFDRERHRASRAKCCIQPLRGLAALGAASGAWRGLSVPQRATGAHPGALQAAIREEI